MGWKNISHHEPIKAINKCTRLSRRALVDVNLTEEEFQSNRIKHSRKRVLKKAKISKALALHLNYKNAWRIVNTIKSLPSELLSSKQIKFLLELDAKLSLPKKAHTKAEVYISTDEVTSAFKLLKKLNPVVAEQVLKNIGR